MLTGSREGEVLKATWEEFDLQRGVWTKPFHNTKQTKDKHIIKYHLAQVGMADRLRGIHPVADCIYATGVSRITMESEPDYLEMPYDDDAVVLAREQEHRPSERGITTNPATRDSGVRRFSAFGSGWQPLR